VCSIFFITAKSLHFIICIIVVVLVSHSTKHCKFKYFMFLINSFSCGLTYFSGLLPSCYRLNTWVPKIHMLKS
jgi:hypothetical protein